MGGTDEPPVRGLGNPALSRRGGGQHKHSRVQASGAYITDLLSVLKG